MPQPKFVQFCGVFARKNSRGDDIEFKRSQDLCQAVSYSKVVRNAAALKLSYDCSPLWQRGKQL